MPPVGCPASFTAEVRVNPIRYFQHSAVKPTTVNHLFTPSKAKSIALQMSTSHNFN
jgi:hypothetical protein